MPHEKIDISGVEVQKLAARDWKVTEIAEYFGVDRSTIHNRFSTELRKGRMLFKKGLKDAQYEVAVKYKNVQMLVWLGRNCLGQSENTLDKYIAEAIEQSGLTKEDLLEMIRSRNEQARKAGKVSFTEFCLRAGYPNPYPKQIEMREFVMTEIEPRLLLGARNYGKTDYTVIMGIAYELYEEYLEGRVGSTNLIVTKSKERNQAILSEIHSACVKNGVAFSRANATHLRVIGLSGKDHSVSCVTLKTVSLRGRHPKRTVMDDPVTEDDVSEASRLLARRKFNEIMKLTKNVCVIGQPAHQYDLYADLRGNVKTMEVPFGEIPELNHDLEAQRIAGVSEASISASYFLKILTEGTAPFDAVKYIDAFGAGDSVAFMDPSEGGDYTAVTILKAYMGGVAVLGYSYKKAWNHCLDDLAPKLRKAGVRKLCFETNKHGDQAIEMLQSLPQLAGIGVVGRRSNGHKHSRIMAAGAYAHLIHISKESDKLYVDHVVKYEYKSKFDDAPDSLATCLCWVGLIRGKE